MIAIGNVSAKIAAVVAGLGLVASSFALAPVARAATVDDLQTQINALLAQIASLQGGSASASMTFTMDLTLGSSGAEVTALQNWLISKGYSIPAGATGYFGAQTQAALAAFQAANGISPAAGYFGPITRAKVNGMAGGSTGGNTGGNTGGGLQGGAGSLEDADFVTSLNNEEVGEDEEDVEVAGLELEADDNSDLEITAVNVNFDQLTANRDFDRYADEVSIWFDGEEVGRVDADDLDDDTATEFEKTISLDNGAIIEAGETGELVVAVSAVSNLDSADIGETWQLSFTSVRYRDADGGVISETSQGDIGTENRTFSFESFASASDTDVHITDGSDEINDSRTIIVDASDETEDEDFFSFNVEIDGDSDINLDEVLVDFDFTGTANTLDDVFTSMCLEMDGDEVGCETVPTSGDDVTFDDLDLDLSAGDEYEFVVVVDIQDLGAATYAQGDTITANIGSTELNSWDAEDESGEEVGNSDFSGAASTEAISFYESGITVAEVSTDSDQNDAGTQGTFTVTFDVTAFGDDQYIYRDADNASSSISGAIFTIYKGGTATSTNALSSAQLEKVSNATDSGSYFKVKEGQTARFTMTVLVDPDAGGAGLYSVELISVRFDPQHTADGTAVEDSTYTVPDSEDVLTPSEGLVP